MLLRVAHNLSLLYKSNRRFPGLARLSFLTDDCSMTAVTDPAASEPVLTAEQCVAERMPYYQARIRRFEELQSRDLAAIEAAKAAAVPIKVNLPDGSTRPAVKGVTTPLDVATDISKGLAKKTVVAKVDGDTWDLFRPLEGDCTLQLFSFEDAEGKDVSELLHITGPLELPVFGPCQSLCVYVMCVGVCL